ncbi:MAG: SpoIIE family protein phosphatase [Candidatus Muiribacteriota bacterium]
MNKKVYEKFSIDDWIKLVNINNAIVSELQLDKVLLLILENALSSIEAKQGSLMLFDENDKDTLRIAASIGMSPEISEKVKVRVGEGISGVVAEKGEPVLIHNIEKDPVFKKKNSPRYFTKSCLSVPLKFRNKITGVFNVTDKKNNRQFSKKDLYFSNTLAQQAAIAIENAKLYMQAKKDKKKVEKLNVELEESLFALSEYTEELFVFHEFTKEIFDKAISHMNIQDLTNEICKLFLELDIINPDIVILNFTDKNIFKVHAKNEKLKNLSEKEKKLIEKITLYCEKNDESIRLPFEEERYKMFEKDVFSFYKSLLAIPLYGKHGPIGTLILLKKYKSEFDEKTRNLMLIFSLQVSTALSLVGAFDQVMKKKVVENELKVAAKIQKMFLPRQNPLVPGMELSHINIPTFDVGGDYIDFLWHDKDRIGIAVGDVSGKGIPASLIMALTKSIVKSNASLFESPQKLLDKINSELLNEIEGHRFVTMIYGLYDWFNRKITIGKAGHNPPIIFKKNGEIIRINPQGLFLGMFRDCIIEEVNYKLEHDDIVVFFTDGVIDIENTEGSSFGLEKMEKVISENREKSCESIKNILIEKLMKYNQGRKQNDDISLVIGKIIDYFDRDFFISSNKKEIPRLHEYLNTLVNLKVSLGDDFKFKLRLIVDEILSNAIEHGNLLNENLNIFISHKITKKYIKLKIVDEGKGFDWQEKMNNNNMDIKSERGRGLLIVRELCDKIIFNTKGNEVNLIINYTN